MSRALHGRYVLDASVAAKWFTRHDEADRATALALRERHRTRRCRLAAPEFALLEILNAVRFSARADEGDVVAALDTLLDLQLELEPLDRAQLARAVAIAWERQLAVYDAAYVAVAEHLGAPLLTADEPLLRKMQGHPLVVRLRDVDLGTGGANST